MNENPYQSPGADRSRPASVSRPHTQDMRHRAAAVGMTLLTGNYVLFFWRFVPRDDWLARGLMLISAAGFLVLAWQEWQKDRPAHGKSPGNDHSRDDTDKDDTNINTNINTQSRTQSHANRTT